MPRHVLFIELYGLTAQQRQQGANQINAALDSEQVSDVISREVNADYVGKFNELALLSNVEFSTDIVGQRIFDTVYGWSRTRATDASGLHSTIRQTTVNEVADTITRWISQSPGWPVAVPVTISFTASKP
jgi:hypothetical protein